MPSVKIREHESFDVAIRRFKRACEKAGIPAKLRQLEFYEKPTTKRKRKRSAAVKRNQKRLYKENFPYTTMASAAAPRQFSKEKERE